MSLRTLSACLLLASCLACGVFSGDFHQPTNEQRLPSGRVVQVTSCQLVWGAEHEERRANQDCFALEYVSSVKSALPQDLDREALDVFELIRPLSEQWGFTTASVSAFPTAERSGKYDVFVFTRGAEGRWTVQRTPSKVFNTESGHKPGHA